MSPTRNMRIRNRAVILILLPITILLWLIGWSLFWTAAQNKPTTPKPPAKTDTSITTGMILEENEEINT